MWLRDEDPVTLVLSSDAQVLCHCVALAPQQYLRMDDDGPLWKVVGGADKGGLIVRLDKETASQAYEARLSTGAIVRQWDLAGDRLQYELVTGSGPETGWVSIKLKDKDLLVRHHGKVIQRLPLGSVLPPIRRTTRCPGGLCVPHNSRSTYNKMGLDKPRSPKLYILMFPGAEDEVLQGWLRIECEAPSHVEVATYEWPGHGTRKDEPLPQTLAELGADAFEAFREVMSTGAFIVVGHSIGALLMTFVCSRAQCELGAVPQMFVVLDRGAPHLPVLSVEGYDLLVNSTELFMSIFSPGRKVGSQAYRLRASDQRLDNDVLPVGWCRLDCCVLVVVAEWGVFREWPVPGATQEFTEGMERLHRAEFHGAPFAAEDYEAWRDWATDCRVQRLDVGHVELKSSPLFLSLLWSEVERVLK